MYHSFLILSPAGRFFTNRATREAHTSQQNGPENRPTHRNRASQVALVVNKQTNKQTKNKKQTPDAGDIRDVDLIPGLGRSPGGGHGNPLQYCCLENSLNRGAWRTRVHGVAKRQTRLMQLSMHSCVGITHMKDSSQHLLSVSGKCFAAINGA